MKLVAAVATIASVSATDVCLPEVHEVRVSSITSETDYFAPFGQEVEHFSGAHVHVWHDHTQEKSLVHIFEDRHHERQSGMMLTDYKNHLRWQAQYNHTSQTLYDCQLAVYDERQEPFCPIVHANLTASGTYGESDKIDQYAAREERPGAVEDIEVLTEAGSTSIALTREVFAERRGLAEEARYYIRSDFFDMVTTPIDSSVFAVPSACPT